jgi:hypothetical protein
MDTVPDKYLKDQEKYLTQIWFLLTSFSFGENNFSCTNNSSSITHFLHNGKNIDSRIWYKNRLLVVASEVKKSFCKTFFEKVVLNCGLPKTSNTYGSDIFIQSIDWKIFTEAKLKIMKSIGNKQEEVEYDLKKKEDIKIYDSQCKIILTLPLDINILKEIYINKKREKLVMFILSMSKSENKNTIDNVDIFTKIGEYVLI